MAKSKTKATTEQGNGVNAGMVRRRVYESWREYLQRIDRYLARPARVRQVYYFRGQPDSGFGLTPTLDRRVQFADADKRDEFQSQLLEKFRREASGVAADFYDDRPIEEVEEVARHHGLPTRLLDWSQSPYIGAYFAFDQLSAKPKSEWPQYVSVWTLFTGGLQDTEAAQVEVIQARYSGNARAYAQRSVFSRLRTNDRSMEIPFHNRVWRLDIPSSECVRALAHLDEMNISPSTLFPDLEGVARAVERREFLLA